MSERPIDRRRFLLQSSAAGAALVLTGCGRASRGVAKLPTLPDTPSAAPAVTAVRPGGHALGDLASAVRGRVISHGSRGYAAAARVYNRHCDGARPLAVVEARDAKDVMAAIAWAGRRGVAVVPRSGGHSYAGYSTGDGVLVLDVRRLNAIQVHGRSQKATIGPGAQLIDVYMRLARRGVTVPAGSCPSVGFGGMATGGGMGLAGRRFGLTCDNVESMDVVTADGALRHVSSRSEPDLFWALRGGGGGNFGVVTRFVMRTHAVSHGSWFSISWPWSQAGAALDAWEELMSRAPSVLTSVFHLSTGASTPQVTAAGQYLGSPQRLQRLLAALPGAPASIGASTYRELMLRWAGCLGGELAACHTIVTSARARLDRARFGAKSDYVERRMSSGARAALVDAIDEAQRHTSEHSAAILLDSYGGAINDVAVDATAFAHRHARCSIQYLTYFGSEAVAGAARAWRQRAWHAMRPYVSGGAYVNYIDPDLAGWQRAYYGANAARLREVKRQVDPDFRFRFAQAIPPASKGASR